MPSILFTGEQAAINISIEQMKKLVSGLYIVATPIGNLEDIGLRAKNILNMVDFIICENPIHSLKLLNKLGIKKKLYSLHDYNEQKLINRIKKYQDNSSIALISDAGSPLISDPGYKLVLSYIEKNLMITSIPGPSSIITALQLSGLEIPNFVFLGFLPKNTAGIKSINKKILDLEYSSVIFVPGLRLISFIKNLIEIKINRKISICKEMTKKNERVIRGLPKDILEKFSNDEKIKKGEFVIVIQGNKKKVAKIMGAVVEKQISKLLLKFSLTDVVEIVHKLTKISKKEIYKTALLIKND